jgi:hypothetical protein
VKPRKTKFSVAGIASAKIEASAKAIIQRKKVITEVIPPDVTRAKAGAWLTLISPITEWAGLKGDALRHKREQLRIQQEITLQRIAIELSKKIGNRTVVRPVPTKILTCSDLLPLNAPVFG